MAEVLSQQEIDQLLNKVKSGDEEAPVEHVAEKEAIPFDFRLPNRISKNQLRILRNVHDNFSESLSSFLVSKLQAIVNISVTSVDQIYYSEYILSVSNPACLYTFDIEETDIKGILEFSPDLALSLVDRLLGGNGTGTKQNNIITPIEQKVLFVVVDRIMQDLNKSWQVIDNFNFKVERFESDIDFAQITSQNESVLLITFEITIGEKSFLLNLCFATFAFDSILAKMSSQKMSFVRRLKHQGATSKEVLSNYLYSTYLSVEVVFGSSTISMKDLYELKEGDIIKLDEKTSSEQVVKVGSKPLFLARAGVVNNNKAIKITRKVDPKS